MDKNFLLHRLMKTKTEDVTHTSAYASSQNKGFGTASTESFATRKAINDNRTTVKNYNNSKIIFDAYSNRPHPATYDSNKDSKIQNNSKQDNNSRNDMHASLAHDATSQSLTHVQTQNTQPRSYNPQIKPDIKPKF